MTTTSTRDLTDHHALAEGHLSLVDQVVHQVAGGFPRYVDRDELRGAGAVGLVDAAHRYDPCTGVPFERYAAIRIRGAILDSTRARDLATRRTRRDLRTIEHAIARLEDRLARTPHDSEIAEETGMDVSIIRRRRETARNCTPLPLDRPVTNAEGTSATVGERVVETDETWLPEAAIEQRELIGTLRTAIAHLPEQPRRVLVEYHFQERLLRDIAVDLGVTEARASQLRHEALHALRAYFNATFEGVPEAPRNAPGRRRRTEFVSRVSSASTWRTRLEPDVHHRPSLTVESAV